jgi:hypothetical protein
MRSHPLPKRRKGPVGSRRSRPTPRPTPIGALLPEALRRIESAGFGHPDARRTETFRRLLREALERGDRAGELAYVIAKRNESYETDPRVCSRENYSAPALAAGRGVINCGRYEKRAGGELVTSARPDSSPAALERPEALNVRP